MNYDYELCQTMPSSLECFPEKSSCCHNGLPGGRGGGGGESVKRYKDWILRYMKTYLYLFYVLQVYPHMDVTNIMESANEVVIENWCNFHGKCHQKHHSHTVRPYRCLGRSFYLHDYTVTVTQSDPIGVWVGLVKYNVTRSTTVTRSDPTTVWVGLGKYNASDRVHTDKSASINVENRKMNDRLLKKINYPLKTNKCWPIDVFFLMFIFSVHHCMLIRWLIA